MAGIKGSRYSTGEGNSVRQTTTTAVKQDGFVKVNYACCNPLLLVLHRIVHNTTQHGTEWTRETPNIISNSICAPKPICYYPALYRSILSTNLLPPASVESFRQTRPVPTPSPPRLPPEWRPHNDAGGESIQIGIQKAIHQCSFSAISIINHEKRSYDFIPTTNFNHLL